MTLPVGFLAFVLVISLALIGFAYLGLLIVRNIGRYTITVHHKTFVKQAITCTLLISLFAVIDANAKPGSFFFPVWHWIESGFTIIATVFVILGIAYLFLPNMPGKHVIEGYYSLPIFKAFRISRKNKSEQ